MNIFFILFFFFVNLHAYQLAETYEYDNNVIHSNDLFPELPQKFEILRIPPDKNHYRFDAQIITKTFELNGITLENTKTRYVNFIKRSKVDFTPLRYQLWEMFTEQYPTIDIATITISSRGHLSTLRKDVKAIFDDRFYQNSKGTFYFFDEHGIRHYLNYSLRATIGVLHTTQKVSRKERLSGFNTLLKPIPFTSFKDKPLTALPEQPSRFRSNLKPSQPIMYRNIETIPLVLKDEKVLVEVKNEGVVVEFVARATQEGLLYDIITILKSDGKRAKAKVIGDKRVELQ
jgi:flagellar basal body P-ring formation protein FlgA